MRSQRGEAGGAETSLGQADTGTWTGRAPRSPELAARGGERAFGHRMLPGCRVGGAETRALWRVLGSLAGTRLETDPSPRWVDEEMGTSVSSSVVD